MSILFADKVIRKNQDEFHAIDKIIMREVFNLHNNLGRFGKEKIYGNALNFFCKSKGISAKQEVKISVSHQDFLKLYFID